MDRRSFLKGCFAGLAGVGAVGSLAGCSGEFFSEKNPKKPNIVLFISDDHGGRDSGAYGDSYIKTPNIDRLAGESMLFTHAFAASPLCSPSRSVIQTGLMPHRNGGHKFGTAIKKDIKTMPEYFQELGYYTAHIGKFHQMPGKQFPYDHIDKRQNQAADYLAGYEGSKPLFLVVCTKPPHTPWIRNTTYDPSKIKLPPNFVDTPETREDRANYYSDVTLMDSELGSVLDAIDRKNLKASTLFIYTTDQGSNWPFSKWCVYDGGLRAPLIARWPGRIAQGAVTGAMVSLADILPTFIQAANGNPPGDIDGRSFLSVLTGKNKEHRKVVFGTHTGNDNGGPDIANHCPARTIRTARYRYIINLSPKTTFTTHITGCKTGQHHLPYWDSWVAKAKTDERAKETVNRYQHRPKEELYDLDNDPFEMKNLVDSPKYSKLVTSLKNQLGKWCKQQGDTLGREHLTD
jgi:arylsulfatase A-like enzyme